MNYRSQGVTLLELMITVAVVAILAAIAYPSYRNQIMRSNRSEARNALMMTSQALERCYTHNRTYAGCTGIRKGASASGYYNVTWNDAQMTDTGFRITATPLNAQAKDTDCGTFVMTEVGRSSVRSDGTTDSTALCWR